MDPCWLWRQLSKCDVLNGEQVKVLGVFGMIDDGETDWKVVTINVPSPDNVEEFVCKYLCVFYIYIVRSRWMTSVRG